MRRLVCSAVIPNEPERKAILAYVKTVANGGFSEKGSVVAATFETESVLQDCGKWWGLIAVFEQYEEHSITDTEDQKGGDRLSCNMDVSRFTPSSVEGALSPFLNSTKIGLENNY